MNNNIPFLSQSRDSSAIQKQHDICEISIHHKQIRYIVIHMLFIDPRQHVSRSFTYLIIEVVFVDVVLVYDKFEIDTDSIHMYRFEFSGFVICLFIV